MSDYIDLVTRLVEKHNVYSRLLAKYEEVANGDPFEVSPWLEKNIESYRRLKQESENILQACEPALARHGKQLDSRKARSTVDVTYGYMGTYRISCTLFFTEV